MPGRFIVTFLLKAVLASAASGPSTPSPAGDLDTYVD